MSLLLYINGQLADLDAGTVIAQTKQVNDLNSLENRQTNYTNKFKLPKTANNVRIMQFLTLPGNNSPVPYVKNECSLYSHTGECFVYNGRAVVTDGGDSYEAVVYDGIIDLYKEIENKTLANLDEYLLPLNHEKDINTVISTWTDNSLPYRYILADYNGNTGLTNQTVPQVNIDYLVPSVKVAWLWEKIFDKFNYGVQPTGAVFNTFNFKELWMTYPKGVSNADNNIEVFQSGGALRGDTAYYVAVVRPENPEFESDYIEMPAAHFIKVKQSGTYRLNIDYYLDINRDAEFYVAINADTYSATQIPTSLLTHIGELDYYNPTVANPVLNFELNQNDTLQLIIKATGRPFMLEGHSNSITIKLTKVTLNEVDFSAAFSDFTIKDFLNEVMHRFGLTMFKDKYSNKYEFLTLAEQLQTPHINNWSSKFSKKVSENYVYGNYAQNNWFRYAYNDKESTHNDGCITIGNINLVDSRDVIKSKIYSPERFRGTYLNNPGSIYKLWDKEVVENTGEVEEPVKYKSLDKRYYFMRSLLQPGNLNLVSYSLGASQAVGSFYKESHHRLPFNNIIADYYTLIQTLLDKSAVITAEIWLTEIDIVNFDFRKPVYIEQLSSYFIVNKIINYIPGRVSKCELVRVQFSHEQFIQEEIPPAPAITFVYINQNPFNLRLLSVKFRVNFDPVTPFDDFQFQYSTNFINWTTLTTPAGNNTNFIAYANALAPGQYHFRMYAPQDTLESDYLTLTLP